MKIIYPNFKNKSSLSNYITIIDKYHVWLDDDTVQIESFEEGCGVYILEEGEYYLSSFEDNVDEEETIKVKIHRGYDPLWSFEEIDGYYVLHNGYYEYKLPILDKPLFYKLNDY